MVMKTAEDGHRYNAAQALDGAMDRGILVERPMGPQLIINPNEVFGTHNTQPQTLGKSR